MTTPFDIHIRGPGDPRLTFEETNALIQAAQKNYFISRGESNQANKLIGKEALSFERMEQVNSHATIPTYSVFTLEDGPVYSRSRPLAKTKQVTTGEPYNVIATNEQWGFIINGKHHCSLIGFEEPKLLRYDSAQGTPAVDDVMGPKPGTYKIALTYNGLVAVSAPDTTNELIWVIRNADSVVFPMFEFTGDLYPGYVGDARVLIWDSTTSTYIIDTADTTTYKLFDPEEQNMFLIGERTHAMAKLLLDNVGATFATHEILGEHGLHRKIKITEDIDCGAIGDGVIQERGTTRVHPPPKTPVDPDCDLGASTATISACNKYGYRRKYLTDEYITTNYDHGRQAWILAQEDRGVLLEATLDADMCPTDTTPAVSSAQMMDWKLGSACTNDPTPAVTSATNSKGLAAKAGDTVFLTHFEGQTGPAEWHIWEVKHVEKYVLRTVTTGSNATCADLVFETLEISLMTCKNDETGIVSLGKEIDVVTAFNVLSDGQGGCTLDYEQTRLCVLDSYSPINIQIPTRTISYIEDITVDEIGCTFDWTEKTACVFGTSENTTNHSLALTTLEVVTDIQDSSTGCDIDISTKFICSFAPGVGRNYSLVREELDVFTGFTAMGTDCTLGATTTKICVRNKGPGSIGTLGLTTLDVITDVSIARGSGTCDLNFDGMKICAWPLMPSFQKTIPFNYIEVADGVVERGNCVDLTMKTIPILTTCLPESAPDQTIFCTVDCTDTGTYSVLTAIAGSGSSTVSNLETQPVDPTTSTADDDIIITFDSSASEGDVIHVTNNSNSYNKVTLKSTVHTIQSLQIGYTAAEITIGGPKFSVIYQLRGTVWRIL